MSCMQNVQHSAEGCLSHYTILQKSDKMSHVSNCVSYRSTPVMLDANQKEMPVAKVIAPYSKRHKTCKVAFYNLLMRPLLSVSPRLCNIKCAPLLSSGTGKKATRSYTIPTHRTTTPAGLIRESKRFVPPFIQSLES